FRIFLSADNHVSLVITGVGKSLAAAAVSYHHACCNTSPADVWLNIGIAGHADLPLGEACLVNKITDAASGATWYPQVLFDAPCPVLPLRTLDTPSEDYQPILYDMEAAGFYALASRLGTSELIHCLKIVSDNAQSHSGNVKAKLVKGYIESQLATMDRIVSVLHGFSHELENTLALPPAYEEIITRWHFTRTQKIQLRECLRRWQSLQDEVEALQYIQAADSARSVLRLLGDALSSVPFTLNSRSTVQQ
ncbi:MAG: hypothetical protein RLT30_09310, partial [Gammaproteobacteria bacterium]